MNEQGPHSKQSRDESAPSAPSQDSIKFPLNSPTAPKEEEESWQPAREEKVLIPSLLSQVIWEAFSLPPLKRQEPETSTQENELNRERKEDRLAIARLALSFGLEAMALMSWFIFGLLLAVKKQGGGLQIGIAGLAVLLALPCVWGLSQLFHVLRLKKGKLSSAHLASALSSLSPLFALKTIVFFGVLASTCFVLSLLVSLFALR